MPPGDEAIRVANRIDFVTGAVRRYVPEVNALTLAGERARAAVEGRNASALREPPAEGEWSAARVLGHMIAYARTLHDQLYRMGGMTDPALPRMDDAAEAERNDWESQPPERLLAQLEEALGQSVDLLRHLPDSSWGRAGIHPTLGRRSIRQQVRFAGSHFEVHLAQLEAALGGSLPRRAGRGAW